MSTTLTIDISDVLQFARDAGVTSEMVRTEIAETAMVAGVMVYQKSIDYVPVDTGTLKASIGPVQVDAAPDTVRAIVPVGAEYAIYVEKGTKFMRGRFFMGRALADRLTDIENAFKDMGDRLLRKMGGVT
jgi:hypothetical protein